jgi:hypothetical protein
MKLQAGQKIWYYNHIRDEIRTGKLLSTKNASGPDREPTYLIETTVFNVKDEILQDWVFGTEKEAKNGFKRIIENKIKRKEEEIKRLREKLKA